MKSPRHVSLFTDNRQPKRSVLTRALPRLLVLLGMLGIALFGGATVTHAAAARPSDLILNAPAQTFASSDTYPLLQYPEGITSWQGKLYVATYNVANPQESRILVFDAATHRLINTLGGQPGQGLISAGPLLGLTIDRRTGYLYSAANAAGYILQIRNPDCPNAQVSIYATYPAGGGPEDLVFGKDGTLYGSDSNLGVVYAVPPGGGQLITLIGPSGSGAKISDNGLFASPVEGLSPNGIVFSQDWRTFFVANSWSDSIIAFDVNEVGQVTGHARVFAQYSNPDLEEYPTGFDALVTPQTHFGASASTPLNGVDGMAIDSEGHLWAASTFGDNLAVLDSHTGKVITTYGTSAVTQGGLMNNPAGMTFIGDTVYSSNMGIFTGLAGTPDLPFRIVSFKVGVSGAGGNGNY